MGQKAGSLFSRSNSIPTQNSTGSMKSSLIPSWFTETTYNDEDQLPPKAKTTPNTKKEIDFEKDLQITLRAKQNCLRISTESSQSLPMVLSVNSKNIDNEDDTVGIDLVIVIDNSGSMSGEKIKLVRETLLFLIELMKPKDRVCLISFESKATKLTPLSLCNEKGKDLLKNKVAHFQGGGSTNILSGMEIATDVLKSRKTVNDVSCIFLLTDGRDDKPNVDERVKNMLQSKKIGRDDPQCKIVYTIHTFGYGSDHQPDMMRNIAQYKDGAFYYIDTLDSVKTCFMDALGGLVSVVCEDLKIALRTESKAPWSDLRIDKTFGTAWSFKEESREHVVSMSQLLGGISREFVFLINFPPLKKNLNPEEKNKVILTANFTASAVDAKEEKKTIIKNLALSLEFFNPDEEEAFKKSLTIDNEVLVNFFRVKAADALDEAIKLSEIRKYAEGEKLLQDLITEIESHEQVKNDPRVEYVIKDLKDSKEKCKPQVFEDVGRKYMHNFNQIHMGQQSNQFCAMYSNARQERYKKF